MKIGEVYDDLLVKGDCAERVVSRDCEKCMLCCGRDIDRRQGLSCCPEQFIVLVVFQLMLIHLLTFRVMFVCPLRSETLLLLSIILPPKVIYKTEQPGTPCVRHQQRLHRLRPAFPGFLGGDSVYEGLVEKFKANYSLPGGVPASPRPTGQFERDLKRLATPDSDLPHRPHPSAWESTLGSPAEPPYNTKEGDAPLSLRSVELLSPARQRFERRNLCRDCWRGRGRCPC